MYLSYFYSIIGLLVGILIPLRAICDEPPIPSDCGAHFTYFSTAIHGKSIAALEQEFQDHPVLKAFPNISQGIRTQDPILREYLFRLRVLILTYDLAKIARPHTVIVQGKRYQMLHILGDGADGVVWIAKDSKGKLVTVKNFYKAENAARHVQDMQAYLAKGIDTLNVFAQSPQKDGSALVVQEYVEGISARTLLEDGEKFGFSKAQLASFDAQLAQWRKDYRFLPGNFFYDFVKRRLVLIDAE
jgi:hypothetical protein